MQTSEKLGILPTLSLAERKMARTEKSETNVEGSAQDRTDFLLEEVCAREEVWVIFDAEGLVAWYDTKTRQDIVPIWPCQTSTEAARKSVSEDAVPVPIDGFIDEILTSLDADEFGISVFPVPGMDYEILSAERLSQAIAAKWATFAKSLI